MSPTLTLKAADGTDIVYNLIESTGSSAQYVHTAGESLLGSSEVAFRLTRKANVNRVYAKLSLPNVCVADCGETTVTFTEVGSIDLSSVLRAPVAVREEFIARFVSLVASAQVNDMFVDGKLV